MQITFLKPRSLMRKKPTCPGTAAASAGAEADGGSSFVTASPVLNETQEELLLPRTWEGVRAAIPPEEAFKANRHPYSMP